MTSRDSRDEIHRRLRVMRAPSRHLWNGSTKTSKSTASNNSSHSKIDYLAEKACKNHMLWKDRVDRVQSLLEETLAACVSSESFVSQNASENEYSSSFSNDGASATEVDRTSHAYSLQQDRQHGSARALEAIETDIMRLQV
jgi:hypothetical protein